MNKDIDLNGKKFLLLLLVICLVFFFVIIKAFEYIPDSESNKTSTSMEMNLPSDENAAATEENAAEEVNQEENQEEKLDQANSKASKKTLNIALPNFGTPEELETVDELPAEAKAENAEVTANNSEDVKPAELSPEEKAEQILLTASKYQREKQYMKALEELKKVSETTNDKILVAQSYEQTANIYAIVKRYGTALSYAQRAYNMSPSSSREMLLARLYYKTGEIDKATRRINNVLQRDFSADN